MVYNVSNMLDLSKTCQKCFKSNCEIIKFNLITKEWYCSACCDAILKAEKEAKSIARNNTGGIIKR